MEAKAYRAEELRTGLKVSYEREITEEDVLSFARLSGDSNPLHVDADYARESNYRGRIVHGAFQVGLASALLGMHLPGKNVLLGSINSRFPSPLYFPTRAKISGEITSWNLQTLGGQLKVVVQEAESLQPTAEISMGFTLHERSTDGGAGPRREPLKSDARKSNGDQRKLVVVTGASGGLGNALVSALANDYRLLALVNTQPLPEDLGALPNVSELRIDLSNPGLEDNLLAVLGSRSVYGVVHAAWPGAPRGSLLQADQEAIRNQVDFGTTLTVRLAKLLFEHVDADGGRFIAIGSTAGSFKPYLPLGVYSLAKACLENTIRLLAPELARKQITINAACPSFVPVGINKQADQRKVMQESAGIPMGRVCQPEDVVGMIRYLLSPEASFVSGQVLALTGAQL
jgi:NAD(P)-dependent dehydrogenase (short-subunit alcohol dehydrogenase family)/acyl dehydratase